MSSLEVTVLGAIRRGDGTLLVQRLTDPAEGPFHRPIGGGVEFGERSDDALEREFREELDLEIEAGDPLGTLENRFTFAGDPAHEVIIVRAARFVDDAVYERDHFDGVDAGGAIEYEAFWMAIDELRSASEPLYPEGFASLLGGEVGKGAGHVDDPTPSR